MANGFFVFLAVRTGLEPATHGVTGRYSNQLNYRTIIQSRCKTNRFILLCQIFRGNNIE